MNFDFFARSPLVENLGWTLLHSLWQGAFIAVWLWIILKCARRNSSNFRYLAACSALCLMLLLPLATFVYLQSGKGEIGAQASFNKAINSQFEEVNPPPKTLSLEKEKGNSGFAAKNPPRFYASINGWKNSIETNFSRVLPLLVVFWLVGAVVFAARAIGGAWHLRDLRRKLGDVGDEWQTKFADLCEKTEIRRAVRICESAFVKAPVVVGWLKPLVLVPSGAFFGLSAAQIEAILVHELMHVRRHDFPVNLVQTAVEILLFYHPCAWWISERIREQREFACDDAVVAFYGDRLIYARALADLEQLRQTANQFSPQLSLAANGGKLMHRIKRIIEPQTADNRSNVFSALAASFVLLALATGVFFGAANFATAAADGAKNKAARRALAVGFVSLPPVDRINPPADADATMRLLIEKLKAHKVPAIGFVQGNMISDGEKFYPVRAEIVRLWRDAGFEIGIGNFKHVWFYDTPYEEYVAGVEKNERITRQLLAEKGASLRYFSYPYLNTGKSAEDKKRFENWLSERNLRSVKYTFDNQEWMYSFAYDAARKDNDVRTMKEIRAEFLDYMTKMLAHYEAYSQETFGRDIPQTLVLTPSRLVTDTADELFGMFETRGYNFVSIDEAQSDAAYKTPENFVGKSGISWFERWTLARNAKLREEPAVNEFVQKIWDERKSQK